MKPAILLVGNNGQVGRELNRMLPQIGDVQSLGREQLDLSKPEEIRRAIRTFRPNLIVNAAAYTAVDKAETEQDLARAVNTEAPAVMAEEAKKIGALLVHYSTDYVFDGTKTSPYAEQDQTNPKNVYGRTKLEGELAIQQSGASNLVFRTAWVYASEGKNFLLTILRLATQREELKIVCDQSGAPTTSREIARATTKILSQIFEHENGSHTPADARGIFHMTAGGQTTWFGFTQAILDHARKIDASVTWFAAATNSRPLIVRNVIPIPAIEYPTPASRPGYSVLSNERLNRTFSVRLPDWQTQLAGIFSNS
ncbi:MAG TPA: dTDP-4-dehydrorhamnose reductase [Candidatus Saccharimonadales bacterium]|jgi:dTDP-4-dehydrorhamnose reductase|nr:dTDP-4-dehydrorhamnose reductase [Candidatus Saccharimonadales bacterium]